MPSPDFLAVKGIDPVVRKQKRQEQFLGLLGEGRSIRGACDIMGLSIKTYEKWCQREPHFKRMKDSILSKNHDRASEDKEVADFPIFRKQYFGFDSPPIHIEISEAIEVTGKIVMILIPPYFGKTTVITDKLCQIISKNPNTRIGYITESQPLANKVSGRIRRRLQDPKIAPRLLRDFGPFYMPGQEKQGKPWGTEFWTVYGANHDENDYTFEALGWSSQIYGARWDLAVLDDYQTLRNSRNKDVTNKMVETFQQDIFTRVDLADGGGIFIIGTRVAQVDFYVKLIDADIPDIVIVRPAIDWQGQSLWPEKWTLEKLERQKKVVGKVIWNRAYMMKPAEDGTATFNEEEIEACKHEEIGFWHPPEPEEEVWAGIDPTLDKFAAFSAVAVNTERFRLMHIEHQFEMSTGAAILAKVYEMWQHTHFTRLIVEVNAFQKYFARDVALETLKMECGFEIIEHTTGANKADATFGVARMASSFIDGSFWLPWKDDGVTRKNVQELIDELLAWRATIPTRLRTQDMLMATWFPWMRWMQMRRGLMEAENNIETIKGEGMPFAATPYGRFTEYAPLIRGRG